jgi:mannose-6-phosphate isomerase-like protein (cupin superfamily)
MRSLPSVPLWGFLPNARSIDVVIGEIRRACGQTSLTEQFRTQDPVLGHYLIPDEPELLVILRAQGDRCCYRDGDIFSGSFSGMSQWERHEQGDEIVYILDGATTLTIMMDEDPQSFAMTAGILIVVTQGHWHQFHSPDGVTVMTITLQPTEHIHADDPRSIALSARCAS